jgi:lysophospholipase L1-like esterase
MKRVILLLLILSLAIISACKDRTDVPTTPGGQMNNNTGDANFTMYVAIGNSITAGMQSNALYVSAQQNSFPMLIAHQVGISSFEQPYISDPGIGGRIRITALVPTPILAYDNPAGGAPTNLTLARPYNNLGVPGAILYDLMDTSSFAVKAGPPRSNPFFQIILRNPAMGKSIIDQASALQPTFITFWIGANDVLGYATSGGTRGTDPTGTQPTPAAIFTALYNGTLAKLKAQNPNAQIVLANVPDVSAIPFFTTVPRSFTHPTLGQVPFMITTKAGARAAGAHDFILLTASSFLAPDSIARGNGTVKPIPDAMVLDSAEAATIAAAVTSFNATIANAASQNGFAMVDMYAFLNTINTTGVTMGGQTFNSKFVTGGIFSFDGVHTSNRGNALIANQFLKVINAKYNANIRLIDPESVEGMKLGKKSIPDGVPIPYYALPAGAAQRIPQLMLGK